MSDSPSHNTPGSAPAPASPGASGQPPRSRRPDYVLTAVVGVIFATSISVLLGLADAAPSSVLRTGLPLGAILLLSSAATALFAGRSSLGALATGLTALAAQSMVFMAPIHASSLSDEWMRKLISTGTEKFNTVFFKNTCFRKLYRHVKTDLATKCSEKAPRAFFFDDFCNEF